MSGTGIDYRRFHNLYKSCMENTNTNGWVVEGIVFSDLKVFLFKVVYSSFMSIFSK